MSTSAGPAAWSVEQVVAWFGTLDGVDPAVGEAVRENDIVREPRAAKLSRIPLTLRTIRAT